ncbi:hypothetical protein BA190_10295 [Labrys sp. WJW]|uniref:hypothetical protein n=1 Tax=Labrys sp. WJW TaxID=1737983 RepID=UPI000834FD75|nr:hypothetical protein [Labrys sp. WJW]OCC05284.1 hypothetical protein BA190_10295 [Labrys sp. WJW]
MSRVPGKHLTPEEREALVRLILSGVAPTIAGRQLGIGENTAQRIARDLKTGASYAPTAEAAAPADPVELRRLRDRAEKERKAKVDAERRAAKAEDLRSAVFGLTAEPLEPVHFTVQPGGTGQAETIVLFLSDLHWGELVDLAQLDGLNSYNLAIAGARLGRWVRTVIDLATRHWSGEPPERIILVLGGDMVSGEIHAELARTNEALALPAVRDLVGHLVGAIRAFRREIGCPVDVISIAGNHGRTTFKPEAKQMAETSYDTLVGTLLEMALQADEGVAFFAPKSPDAVFSVYGWQVLATHGDRIGSRGGQGFIGPAATAARGFKRLMADYATRRIHLDLILAGHFHTPLQLEEGFINGSLPGPTEYSRDGRFRPHPPKQLFLTMHPRRLIAQVRWIEVGRPEEGTLFEPRSIDQPLRPRYRVPAIREVAA